MQRTSGIGGIQEVAVIVEKQGVAVIEERREAAEIQETVVGLKWEKEAVRVMSTSQKK